MEVIDSDCFPSSACPLFSDALPNHTYTHHCLKRAIHCPPPTSSSKIPLFLHEIWPGSIVMADYLLEQYFPTHPETRTVLELGAGGGLPSLLCGALSGVKVVVATDYPDPLIDNIAHLTKNITRNKVDNKVISCGYIWGDEVSTLSCHIESSTFDLLILSELLWKDTYTLHRQLLKTVKSCLATNGVALITFVHRPTATHRPENDLEFFQIAQDEFGLRWVNISTCSARLGAGVVDQDSSEGEDDVHLYSLRHQVDNV